jgi:hypothetical protein
MALSFACVLEARMSSAGDWEERDSARAEPRDRGDTPVITTGYGQSATGRRTFMILLHVDYE